MQPCDITRVRKSLDSIDGFSYKVGNVLHSIGWFIGRNVRNISIVVGAGMFIAFVAFFNGLFNRRGA